MNLYNSYASFPARSRLGTCTSSPGARLGRRPPRYRPRPPTRSELIHLSHWRSPLNKHIGLAVAMVTCFTSTQRPRLFHPPMPKFFFFCKISFFVTNHRPSMFPFPAQEAQALSISAASHLPHPLPVDSQKPRTRSERAADTHHSLPSSIIYSSRIRDLGHLLTSAYRTFRISIS
jgi:hypothetical protein